MPPSSPLWVSVSKAALAANYATIRARAEVDGSCRLCMAVVKANAYGHGVSVVVPELDRLGVDGFGVYTVAEAETLYELGIRKPILILGPVSAADAEIVVRREYRLWLDDLSVAEALAKAAERLQTQAKVHLCIDTGMSREGIWFDDTVTVAPLLAQLEPHLRVEGIGTHFASAEDAEKDSDTTQQIERFELAVTVAKNAGLTPSIRTAANSAGLLRHARSHYEMVRVGAAFYGIGVSSGQPGIHAIASLQGRVERVKKAKKGERVGYGGTFVTTDDIYLLQIAAGYADGLNRYLANAAAVLVGESGARGLVAGTISMNTTMVVVDAKTTVVPGDVVTFIGTAGGQTISADVYRDSIPNLRVPHVFTQLSSDTVQRVLVP